MVLRGLEPVTYIKSQFWQAEATKPPLPDHLTSETALLRYDAYCRTIQADLAARLAYEIGAVQTELLPVRQALQWTEQRAMQWALNNTRTVRISPLVRYCLAVEYGLDAIAARYYDPALFQYTFQMDAYDAAWPAGIIPESLRRSAQALHARLSAGQV
jgi:hypothetical protein